MTLYQIVSYLKQIALSSPYIRSAYEGSVYQCMNGNPHSKYGVFVVSQTLHRQDEIFDYYGLNLFVIDRLVDDLDSNRLQIQSLAKEVLANTILTFVTKFYGIIHNELQFHPFTEKFVDLTAGQYVQVTFQVPRSLICPDDYNLDFYDKYRLLPLNVEITDNGIYEYNPVSEDYDGYDSVKITVNVPQTGTSINNQTKTVEVVENGDYVVEFDEGYTGLDKVNFNVDVSGYTQEDLDDAYESGITSGVCYQKSLLQDITITHNGEYTNENGYSAITVNVPQSGESIYNQAKSIEYSGNGEYTLTYDEGYTGLEAVNININVPQSAYTSGYTEQDLINAYNSGITYQKSLLSAVTLTENGTYIYPNGVSAITVNVSGDTPTPPTPSGDTSGYTDMYLTFEIISGGTIYWFNDGDTGNTSTKTIYYSINNGEWISVTSSYNNGSGTTMCYTNAGDIIRLKGNNTRYYEFENTHPRQNRFKTDVLFNVKGNIMSLIYGDNFKNNTVLTKEHTFSYLFFSSCRGLKSAEHLILPSTTLVNHCYESMFQTCTGMTTAPVLSASTLAQSCYRGMFYGCYSLNYIKCLASDLSAYMCVFDWVFDVKDSGVFVKKAGVNWPRGNSGIPSGWTVIEE